MFDDPTPPHPRARRGASPAELDEVFTHRPSGAGAGWATLATAAELDEVFGVVRGHGLEPNGADEGPRPVGRPSDDGSERGPVDDRGPEATAAAGGASDCVDPSVASVLCEESIPVDPSVESVAVDEAVASVPVEESIPGDESVLSAPVVALVAAVAAVGEQVPSELAGAQAVAEATVLLQQLEALRAVVLSRVADVDVRKLHTLADAPSTGSWIAAQQTSVTRAEVAFARRLQAFPAVADAVERGALSVAVAGRVAAALSKLRRHVDRPDGLIDGQPAQETVSAVVVDGVLGLLCQARGGLTDDDARLHGWHRELSRIASMPTSELARLADGFVLLATHLEPADVPAALGQLTDALLPNELERRARDGQDARGVTLRRKEDGSGWLITRGELDLECGELLHALLTAELAVDPDNPVDTAAYAAARSDGWDGDPETLPEEAAAGPRSLAQRRHDALRNGLRRYLDAGLAGLRDKVAPHLSVTVSLQTLRELPGAPAAVAASGSRLPRSLVKTWWCDSAVSRFVIGLGHRVIETSHTERTLRPHERRAKRVETGGRCQAAGCRCGPDQRLVPHHPHAYAVTGTTSLRDTVLLCEQDHHHLHAGQTIRLRDGRRLGPHGWVSDQAA